jgi:hypothetical protein
VLGKDLRFEWQTEALQLRMLGAELIQVCAEIPTGLLRFVFLKRDPLALFAVHFDIKPLEPIGDGIVVND